MDKDMKRRIIKVIIIAIIAAIISVLMNQNEITKTVLNLVIDIWWVVVCWKIVWAYIKYGTSRMERKE
uniref:Uncharacterized protein n=1 Tax=Siphoviridae sp. ct96x5 TaxID=2825367 RepID=A0A8S5PQT3_9CAUD|nr:MAG TPA: hypothetical protein [Siphoviridae sp. ct96x5]